MRTRVMHDMGTLVVSGDRGWGVGSGSPDHAGPHPKTCAIIEAMAAAMGDGRRLGRASP